jgi:hypothetical protein
MCSSTCNEDSNISKNNILMYAISSHKANCPTGFGALVDARFRCCLIRSTRIDLFDVAFVGVGNYVVVVLHVGGSKASGIRLIQHREPHTGKKWLPAGLILPNE